MTKSRAHRPPASSFGVSLVVATALGALLHSSVGWALYSLAVLRSQVTCHSHTSDDQCPR